MTLLALALAGFKSIDAIFTRANCEHSVAHLSDAALDDIGLAREGKRIVAVSAAHSSAAPVAEVDDSEHTVIMIPHYLCEDGG